MTAPTQPNTHDTPVMVIDDDTPLIRMIAEILFMEGYLVWTTVVPFQRADLMIRGTLRQLQQAARPTIILADPTTFGISGTEVLCDYLRDEAQRQPHLLYLMTALPDDLASNAMTRFHADGLISMPIDWNILLALIADGEHILRDRSASPPDPFTIAF